MKNTVVGMMAVLLAVSMLVGCNDEKELKLEGNWKLMDGSQSPACFSEMKFLNDPTSKKSPLSVHETTHKTTHKTTYDYTQIWFGEYEEEGNEIRVILHEPKADPFVMTADRSGNELKLQYEWKSEDLVCSYQLDK
ncbi:hypothetical protein ACQKP0_12155 [Heyndrickxia sp. NPDC080065]|uniref:hypothetical protein n=1 Tax=Heyndrickxia sp. NPDC080065 TaxID=3390568 RepID=UPI003D04FAEE